MVWPHWQGFGAMSRRGRPWSRLIVAVLALTASVYGSLWAYIECAAHRAKSMLVAASRIRVGDTEASVLPLVERFGGYKWTPEQLSPREQWIDKDEYDYQKTLLSDYKYELGISPFATTALRVTRLTQSRRQRGKPFQQICGQYSECVTGARKLSCRSETIACSRFR